MSESWFLEHSDAVIESIRCNGFESLEPQHQLVYLLWILDYSIRNSGDLLAGDDLRNGYLNEGLVLAGDLSLCAVAEAFAKAQESGANGYYSSYEAAIEELRKSA